MSITKDYVLPSHLCNHCGALWRVWLPDELSNGEAHWSLCSRSSCSVCGNAQTGSMGPGVVIPLTIGDKITIEVEPVGLKFEGTVKSRDSVDLYPFYTMANQTYAIDWNYEPS